MKKENKCFFSIGLANGITISGDNPQMVLSYLYDMHSAFFQYYQYLSKIGLKESASTERLNMFIIGWAIDTVKKYI